MDIDHQFNEAEIDALNDDCMAEIFCHLSISERIRMERVCKRWNTLVQISWSDCHELLLTNNESTDDVLFNTLSSDEDEHTNISGIVSKVLKKCSKYLKKIELKIPNANNTAIVLCEIEKYCNNIETFKLYSVSDEYEYDENILGSFFSKNKNLKELNLASLCITGFSFLNLHTKSLESLMLCNCDKFKKINALKVFQKFKSLKTFKLVLCEKIAEPALLGFIKNDCQVSEFCLGGGNSDDLEDYNELLTEFLPKQKNLNSLKLIHQYISDKTLEGINDENIEKLALVGNHMPFESVLSLLSILKNLNFLNITLFNDVLNDKFMQALSKCKNLFELRLMLVLPILITLESKIYFKNFSNLSILMITTLHNLSKFTNEFLTCLGECKNLKVININNKHPNDIATNVGMMAITSLPNLEILIIGNFNSITDEVLLSLNKNMIFLGCINCKNIGNKGLEIVVEKCENLNLLLIPGCQSLKINKLIEAAGKFKNNSANTNVLKVMVSDDVNNIDELNNISSLIEVKQDRFEHFDLESYMR